MSKMGIFGILLFHILTMKMDNLQAKVIRQIRHLEKEDLKSVDKLLEHISKDKMLKYVQPQNGEYSMEQFAKEQNYNPQRAAATKGQLKTDEQFEELLSLLKS